MATVTELRGSSRPGSNSNPCSHATALQLCTVSHQHWQTPLCVKGQTTSSYKKGTERTVANGTFNKWLRGMKGVEWGREGSACETAEQKIKGSIELIVDTETSCWCSNQFAHHTLAPLWNDSWILMIKALDIHLTITCMVMSHRVSIWGFYHSRSLAVLPRRQAQAAFSLIWGGGLCVQEQYTRPGWIIQLLSQHGNIRPLSPL